MYQQEIQQIEALGGCIGRFFSMIYPISAIVVTRKPQLPSFSRCIIRCIMRCIKSCNIGSQIAVTSVSLQRGNV